MHPLHEYVSKQLADRLKSKKLVVWYDGRSEFAPFVRELRQGASADGKLTPISVAGTAARLTEYAGSLLELRAVAEPYVSGDSPESILVYVAGYERDRDGSVLMELEKAGECYEPQLKRLARNVLRVRYTDGVIDELLSSDRVTYDDLARACSDSGSTPPSLLKGIFTESSGTEGLLAAWLASDSRDADIVGKGATRELFTLVKSRLGLDLAEDSGLNKARAVTARYVLAGEFRGDLKCDPPACLDGVPTPKTKAEMDVVRDLAGRLRTEFSDMYPSLADRVEEELRLKSAQLPVEGLGAVDTFRFEERSLLAHCNGLVANEKFEAALALVLEREHSFWLHRDVERKAQWEACRRMAELGSIARSVREAVKQGPTEAVAWMASYAAKEGWYRLDRAQRQLEAWIAKLDEEPDEKALGIARRAYDDTCQAMALGFVKALAASSWAVPGAPQQTRVCADFVEGRTSPVAYFLVDALRYEMGAELADQLPASSEISLRYAAGALPSITPVGMAALQPGASASFSVQEQGGKLGAVIGSSFLPDVAARKKAASGAIPTLVDLGLDELLGLQPRVLAKRVDGARVVVVRSQEIDHAGEAGFIFQARQVMDTVIPNLARAIRKLAAAGVETAVVTADHGHLFFGSERDESMRIDAPGGDTVELHRRCWIGRGGSTPKGCVRVSAASLGYSSDLEFVFPAGVGVFRAGGDLAFVHGGPSLQEMVIPVVTVRTKVEAAPKSKHAKLNVTGLPTRITNRIFTASLEVGGHNLALFSTPTVVRPFLVSGDRQVGGVGMAIDAQLDQANGSVKLEPGRPATVAFQLSDDSVTSLRVVILDPATDAELYRSPNDIPVELGV